MKLRVEDITAEAKEISFLESEKEVNRTLEQGPIKEYRVSGPIRVTLSYYRAGTDLFFQGRLAALTEADCARCAEEFTAANERRFRFILVPKAVGDDGRNTLRTEDLEFSVYGGEEIDLAPLIREQLLLALPTRPLCREECRGLCPLCGANLNNARCDCRPETFDPRLAVLRSLKSTRS